ncbi:MAG: sodium:solute symporter family transporter, partial [Phycisphaerae bacterium]
MLANSVIELHWADWAVIALYGVAMFGIAIWAFRKINDCGGFLLGKRKMGKLMMMATTFAGGTNANHPMGVAAATYREGLSGMWLSLTWMLITPFFWMYPPVLRRLRIVTMVDLVRHRFGKLMAGIFKFIALVGTPISIGFGIKSAAVVVEVMTGGAIDGVPAMLFIIVPTVIYSLMGGVIAAYATDVMQGLLIVVLSFLLIPFSIAQAGGIEQLNAGISGELTQLIATEGG